MEIRDDPVIQDRQRHSLQVITCGNKITFDELELYLKDNLAYFKVPSLWEKKLKSLPRNASGKVMKHVLIDQSKNNFVEDE